MPSLSRTTSGQHAVAERLLVAVGEVVGGPDDPLEPGERLAERQPAGGAELGQQRRGHDRRRVRAGAAGADQVVGQQHAELVAGQQPPAGAVRHRDRAPVRVRVVGDQQVGAGPLGQRQREVERAGLLGVGERRRSGSPGRARPARPPAPAARTRPGRTPAAARAAPTPCSAVWTVLMRRCPVRVDHGRHRVHIGLEHLVAEHRVRVGHRDRRQWTDRGHRRLDLGVHRRHDLRAVGRCRPCSRCPAAGCGWRSPSPRRPRRAAGPRSASTGVGSGPGSSRASRPAPASTAAESAANSALPCRAS